MSKYSEYLIDIMQHPEVSSISPQAKQLVVFFHGLGSNGNDLISLVPFFQERLKDIYFFSPHGVEPYDLDVFGRQWFSCKDRSSNKIRILLEQNLPDILDLISNKQKILSITNDNTILIGFSQGGLVASYLALSQNSPFKAVIILSSYLILPSKIVNKLTPFFILHGEEDDILPPSLSLVAEKQLKKEKIFCQTQRFPQLAHSIDARVIKYSVNIIESL